MEITRVNIFPSNDEDVAALCSITFDDCFMVHGLRVKISKKGDYFLFMSDRKQADGAYTEIVFAVNNETRRMIEEKVFAADKKFAGEPDARPSRWKRRFSGADHFSLLPSHFTFKSRM